MESLDKMKLYIHLIIFTSLCLSCSTNTNTVNNETIINDSVGKDDYNPNVQEKEFYLDSLSEIYKKGERLKNIYKKLPTNSNNRQLERQYFEEFPNTFMSFSQLLFGTTIKKSGMEYFKPGPLYDSAEIYIKKFYSLSIDKRKFCAKIIEISIGGKWDADGITSFQLELRKEFSENIHLFCKILLKMKEHDIRSFWYFFFDEPHPEAVIPKEFDTLDAIAPKIYSLMKKAYKDVLKNSGD